MLEYLNKNIPCMHIHSDTDKLIQQQATKRYGIQRIRIF